MVRNSKKNNVFALLFIAIALLIIGLMFPWMSPEGFWYSLYQVNVYGLWGWIFIISALNMILLFFAVAIICKRRNV